LLKDNLKKGGGRIMNAREKSSSVFGFIVLIAISIIFLPLTASAGSTVVLKLGHIGSTLAPYHKAHVHFSGLVAKKTNGAVKIDIYPASQLGSANKMIKGLPAGTVDMVPESVGRFAAFEPGFKLFDLPFFVKDNAHAKRIMDSAVGQELLERVRKKTGIILLNYNLFRLPRHLYTTKKPVFRPADMKGMKIRVKKMKQFVLFWEGVGAIPVAVRYAELYTALSQGMAEAMEGTITAGWGKKFYEVLKYTTLIGYTHELHGYMMSEKKFKSFPPKIQKALKEATVEAGVWYTKAELELEKKALEDYKKAGVAIIDVDVEPFKKLTEGLPQKLEAEGEWEKGLYERMSKIK
jgi:C4-dicarboxylate-binding protein DctP